MQTLASSKLAPKSAAARPAARRSVVVRAEGTGLAPVERNKGQLFLGGVTDKAALSYLTGALPGDKGCAAGNCICAGANSPAPASTRWACWTPPSPTARAGW